jgi:cyclohexadienyl dehydratase
MRLWIAALLALACASGSPNPSVLRVGTSGDYPPFSGLAADGQRTGIDVELVQRFARAHGARVRWVPVEWTTLQADFEAGRFDLVASGVTVRPERSLAGRFSLPTASAGAVALVRGRVDLERSGVRIAVNRGGHLERVTNRLFPRAVISPITPNHAVREALLAGSVDAAITDTTEAPHWLAGTEGLSTLGPFTRDWKAWWLPSDADDLMRQVDAWLSAREADGSLAALRARHFAAAIAQTATPLEALGAAIEERLALMPLVAEAKRRSGTPVHVPAQEARVLEAAVVATRGAAQEAALPIPDATATRALFMELIAAARAVQEHTLTQAPAPEEPPDLPRTLRSALARISERISWLLVRLPQDLGSDEAADAFGPLMLPGVDDEQRQRIASAVVALARAPRQRVD